MTDDLSKNLYLEALRRAYPERDERDRPEFTVITDFVDGDGMVTRVRELTWEEALAGLVRDCRGDVW